MINDRRVKKCIDSIRKLTPPIIARKLHVKKCIDSIRKLTRTCQKTYRTHTEITQFTDKHLFTDIHIDSGV